MMVVVSGRFLFNRAEKNFQREENGFVLKTILPFRKPAITKKNTILVGILNDSRLFLA